MKKLIHPVLAASMAGFCSFITTDASAQIVQKWAQRYNGSENKVS